MKGDENMDFSFTNGSFWKAALNRAGRTFFQGLAASLPATALINQVDWKTILLTGAFAFVASIITSCAFGIPEA